MNTIEQAIIELAETQSLQISMDAFSPSMYGESTYTIDGEEWLIVSSADAIELAHESIKELVWAFKASFLSSFTGIDKAVFEALSEKCEGGNEAILSLIEANGGFSSFAEEAISCDGLGHFLSPYDGEEIRLDNEYMAFRMN